MKPRVLIITGPTGSGKTSLALEMAKKLPLAMINADSLQFFRMMDIGTAKPTSQERKTCPHHLWDVLNPDEEGNAAWFSKMAARSVEEAVAQNQIPCLVGGSGFYIRAFENPPQGPASQTPELPESALSEAYERIKREDPVAAGQIHPNDRYRISRAISVLDAGEKPSKAWSRASSSEPLFEGTWLGLAIERKNLYDRINQRSQRMFDQGLLEETSEVLERFPGSRFRLERTIGYREALAVLEGQMDMNEAIEKTQQSTRQYAKRQLTWFRGEERMHWLEQKEALGTALKLVEEKFAL